MSTWKKGRSPRAGNGRASKYNNRRINTVHGWFDSKGELQRWLFLLDAARLGAIKNLRRQVEFPLMVNDALVCTYVADYVYDIVRPYPHENVVEDFKGFITDEFKLKAKLFKAVHGFPIRVVKIVTEGFALQG
jgi:hypothetical protein